MIRSTKLILSNKSVDNPDSVYWEESLRGIWRKFNAGGVYQE